MEIYNLTICKSELAGEVEADVFEIVLSHLEHIATVGQEDVAAFAVLGHVLELALLEGFELGGVVTLNPAGFLETDRFPTALGIVLVLKTVLDDLELKLSDGTDELTPIELVDKELCHTFVHQLVDTLGQLLLLHGVGILDILEHLRREAGDTTEMEFLSLSKRVTNLEGSIVRQSDDVARPSFVNGSLALGHELCRAGETHGLVVPHVIVRSITRELARADFTESNARTVIGVDVGRNLEDEACELLFIGIHLALLRLGGTRTGSNLHKGIEQLLNTKVVQSRTEEDRCQLASEVFRSLELGIDPFEQLQFTTEFVRQI